MEGFSKAQGRHEPDNKEDNSFAAAYGVEISDEGYAALAQEMSGGPAEAAGNEPKEKTVIDYTRKLEHSGWGVPMYSGPDGFIDNISHDITQIFSNTDPKDKAIAEYGFFWPADWACS